MSINKKTILSISIILLICSLSCGLFGRSGAQPDSAGSTPLQLIRQWASSATAGSEYGNPDWAAHQATGAPDTPNCGDLNSAWASLDQYSVEWLEVRYSTPVIPFEVNIYESHTPSQVVLVEVLDTEGAYHQVYEATPSMMPDCPYVLSFQVEDAEYQGIGVRITVDQTQLGLPWDEIDAVELVGYGEFSNVQNPSKPEEPSPQIEPKDPTGPALSGGETLSDPSGNWTTFSSADGLDQEEVHAITVGAEGIVWIASGQFGKQSLVDLNNGVFTTHNVSPDGRPVTVSHYGMTAAPDGTVWVATGTKLTFFNGQDWVSYTKKDGLLDDQTKSVALANDGTLWVGSVAGVSRFDGISWESFTKDDGLIDTFIEAIAVDSLGNTWFVSSFGGASYFDGKKWTSFHKGKELPNYPHSSIAIASDGSVWIGSGGGGVSRFDGRDWTTYTVSNDYNLEYVKVIMQGPDGSLWFGTEGQGVYRFDGQTWTNLTKENGLCYDYVDSIAAGPDGSIWFGCRKNGVTRYVP
jgi:ligand-binding sensor domain-containing protein